MDVPLFLKNRLIFSHEILYRGFYHYSDGHYTKNVSSHHLLLPWEVFWRIFGLVVLEYVCFFIACEPFNIFS